jgi:hypothetical protein
MEPVALVVDHPAYRHGATLRRAARHEPIGDVFDGG